MRIETVLEVLTAAHLTAFVESPFESRGGIMLVAPPASLKSTIVKQLVVFPNAVVLSDINVRQLAEYRREISNKTYTTMVFTAVEKLYQRHEYTSSNLEGHLMGMCEEGFRHSTMEDHRTVVRPARCLVIGAMTDDFYHKHYSRWVSEGFARRFLWCHYILKNPMELMTAIHKWKPIEMIPDRLVFALPKERFIPYDLSDADSGRIARLLMFYKQSETPFILLKKIACVLKWRHQGAKYMEILRDFSESLSGEGAYLETLHTAGVQEAQEINGKEERQAASEKGVRENGNNSSSGRAASKNKMRSVRGAV